MTGFNDALARRQGEALLRRLDELAVFTDVPGEITRLYLTSSYRGAADQVAAWMRQAGMRPHLDAAGNVVGDCAASDDPRPLLLLGSHIDSVRHAGRYDGTFGVLAAIAAIATLGEDVAGLPVALRVLAFGDEEGVRFPVTMTGSRALAGGFDPAALQARDAAGKTLAEALADFGCDADAVAGLSLAGGDRAVAGYIEAHIEQGPVLEAEGLPLGVVTAIAGATRLLFTVTGTAGHAGTVPMSLRHDALTAACAIVLRIEQVARAARGLVATVGTLQVRPGAPNSIAGEVSFTLDCRAPDDATRASGLAAIGAAAAEVAAERGVRLRSVLTHDAPAVACDPALQDGFARALDGLGLPVLRLPSGAGHDAMAMARLCPVGMLFVRCWRGISHHPDESITALDAGLAVLALTEFLRGWR